MNDREMWRERVRDIRASHTTWWWCVYIYIWCVCVCVYIYIYLFIYDVCIYIYIYIFIYIYIYLFIYDVCIYIYIHLYMMCVYIYNLNIVTLTLWTINYGVLTSLLLPHLSSSLTDSQPSLNLLCHSKTDARFLKQNFTAYRSSSHPDCIFEIHQLWQSGFSRVYSNCCCRCPFFNKI